MILVAALFYVLNIFNVKDYFNQCKELLKPVYPPVKGELLVCLQLAEDRRNKYHLGVDYIGLVRAIFANFRGSIQGASTIEQQFVRTVIKRYERTFSRKILEQMIAHLLCLRCSKNQISKAYLNIAYFGTGIHGYHSLIKSTSNTELDLILFSEIIARLKYPEPKSLSYKAQWYPKMLNRRNFIIRVFESNYARKDNSLKNLEYGL